LCSSQAQIFPSFPIFFVFRGPFQGSPHHTHSSLSNNRDTPLQNRNQAAAEGDEKMLSSWTKSAALLLGLVFLLLPSADATEMKCTVCKGAPGGPFESDVGEAKDAVEKARGMNCEGAAAADIELDCFKRNKPDDTTTMWSCMVDKNGNKDCMKVDSKFKKCEGKEVMDSCACEGENCNKDIKIKVEGTDGKPPKPDEPEPSAPSEASPAPASESSEGGSTAVKGWPFELLLLAAALVWGQQLRSQA